MPKEKFPTSGRSYWNAWQEQKKVFIEALKMKNGEFIHSLIVFCWPRGEGKSFGTILIQLWRFFCWPKQKIVLCSNSKDLSSFLLYSELQSILFNSPKLLKIVGGKKNIQEKGVRRVDKHGNLVSSIQTISSASGIVSNATGYSYTEFFENKFPKFFEKLDTSMRNTPNALGVIDSTVSSKAHKLYHLYQISVKKQDPKLYFSYRYSKDGDYQDFWHPKNDQAQLNSFRVKHPMGGFARMFQNLWSAGAENVFSQEEVDAFNYIGADGSANCHKKVIGLIRRRSEIIDSDKKLIEDGVNVWSQDKEIINVEKHLWPVSDVYSLQSQNGMPILADASTLDRLTEIYDTEWAIIGGIDRADPMKRRTAARSIFTAVAKGLPGSLSNPNIGQLKEAKPVVPVSKKRKVKPELEMPTLSYVYFLLNIVDIQDHSLEEFKKNILLTHEEYGGIDVIGSERYGAWDMVPWGEDNEIKFELVHPNYGIQLAMFTYYYTLVSQGRFKGPPSSVPGSRLDDIVKEEMTYFDHDDETKWFGSPEKQLKYGVQDDFVFALANGIYAGRFLGVDDFRSRSGEAFWGQMYQPTDLKGDWGNGK